MFQSQKDFVSEGFTEIDYKSNKSDNKIENNGEEANDELESQYLSMYDRMIDNQPDPKQKRLICTVKNCQKEFSSRFCLKRHFLTIHCK